MGERTAATDDGPEGGLSNRDALRCHAAFMRRWSEIMLRDIDEDIGRIETLDPFDQVYRRAHWSKIIDLTLQVHRVMEERYTGARGELRLVEEKFGEQLNLPVQVLPEDIQARRDWYKRRLAKRYETHVLEAVKKHNIGSPIEQIFLMEWHYDERPKTLGLNIEPQFRVETGRLSYVTDFRVSKLGSSVSICVELDGHEFHERTAQQAAADKKRERAIVAQGHALLRFTGREVFRNPSACLNEVIALAERGG